MSATRFALPPQYDPHAVERPLYQRWLERGVFTARVDSPKPPYVIVIPPPNVTAVLHMGQGLNNVTQDVLIRFERMRGREALWLPGTDHAGIATQNVVERLIAKEGKTRFDLGREALVARVWAFVRDTGATILEQLKMIGASCDWSRTRFTFDPAYSRAVREVFVRLWEEGLIYRGHRVIHWCPRCLTALSDEEAESRDIEGKLYYIRYPVEGGPAPYLTVATTRPETLLGDTAVAVNPEDARHRGFVGKVARLPLRLVGGAAAVRSMVREDAAARTAGARGVPRRGDSPRPRALGRDVRALDGEHPRLEHLAAAVVGPPHPGVHLHQVRPPPPVGRPRGPEDLPHVRRPGRTGPRRARHLVLVLAVAVRPVRLAGPDAGPGPLLSRPHARHGRGHPVLLGRPHDHGGLPLPRRQAVPDGVPPRHRARHRASQDVEVARQRDRPARRGPAVRRGRAALDDHRRRVAGVGPDPRPQRPRGDLCAGPQLREQAVEHRALHPGAAAGARAAARGARREGSAARRSVDPVARAGGDPRRDGIARDVPARRSDQAVL